jgi:ABC-2 type transport system permease protein
VPLLTLAGLFLGLQAPPSLASGLAFVAAMFGALLLSCAITNLMNISLMWTVSGEGITGLVPALVVIFSGMIVPLPFFPDWAQTVLRVMPFAGLVDTPFRLYLGHIPASDLPIYLAHQLGWTVAFVILGRWILSRGLRRLTVQGG